MGKPIDLSINWTDPTRVKFYISPKWTNPFTVKNFDKVHKVDEPYMG